MAYGLSYILASQPFLMFLPLLKKCLLLISSQFKGVNECSSSVQRIPGNKHKQGLSDLNPVAIYQLLQMKSWLCWRLANPSDMTWNKNFLLLLFNLWIVSTWHSYVTVRSDLSCEVNLIHQASDNGPWTGLRVSWLQWIEAMLKN